jgi:hypothetical protein
MSSVSWPELAGTLFPPISRPRSGTSAFLASAMTISVLTMNLRERSQRRRQAGEKSSPDSHRILVIREDRARSITEIK